MMHELEGKTSASQTTSPAGSPRGKNKGKAPYTGSAGFLSNLRNFDIFPKLEEDFRIQTPNGGILSLAGWFIIAVLVLGELRTYVNCNVHEHMAVDTTMTGDRRMQINVDISFHALTCAQVHLDAMDVAGDNQVDIDHDVTKQRISEHGEMIGNAYNEIISKQRQPPLPKDYCGSCYGAETADTKCCNTCEELRIAYEARGWNAGDLMRNSTQCNRERLHPHIDTREGEGCRISGKMLVNRVAGNFHIAHGESMVRDGRHIHQFMPEDAPNFNVSHTVHSVSFGSPYPSMPSNPLDGRVRYVNESTGLHQYFMKVTPTVYTDKNSWFKLFTNQFTATERFRPYVMPKPNANGQILPTAVSALQC
jgi:hypothetical protein